MTKISVIQHFINDSMKKTFLPCLFILGVFYLNACKQTQQKFDIEHPSFATQDAAEMFFKNVRQIYYHLEEQPSTKLRLYRLKKQDKTTQDNPIINLTLVHNWRYDEAYLLIEPNAFFEDSREIKVHWRNPNNQQEEGIIELQPGNKTVMLRFAYQIYQKLLLGYDFWLVREGKSYDFISKKQEREAFRISVADYLRLIGAEE